MLTITDMAYVNGNVLVAGLSNEEWASSLRSIPYPFKDAAQGSTVQIWHASHGRYETQAPVRTFVPYTISGKEYILAAYTCTPLVKIPVTDLTPGAKVKGTTIADLGSGSQPLDMVPYKKDGHEYILVANSSRGVMKLRADKLDSYPTIDSPTVPNPPTNIAGVPYDTLSDLKGVQHVTRLDDKDALLLIGTFTGGRLRLDHLPGPSICKRLSCRNWRRITLRLVLHCGIAVIFSGSLRLVGDDRNCFEEGLGGGEGSAERTLAFDPSSFLLRLSAKIRREAERGCC